MVVVETLKLPDAAPPVTWTEPGTESVVLELVSVTSAPAAGAGPLRLTVQVALLLALKVEGRQEIELTTGVPPPDVTVPPVVVNSIASPAADEPAAPVTPIAAEVAPAASVTLTTATVPFAMMVLFIPYNKHE
jgi:hypothetical protein